MKAMLTEEQEALVKSNRDAILNSSTLAKIGDSLTTFGTNLATGAPLSADDQLETAKSAFIGRGALAEAGATFDLGSGVFNLKNATISTSNVMLTATTAKKDDVMIPPGGGSAVISAPAGTFQLNPQDTIVAGTDLFASGNTTGNDNNLSTVMMQVGRMIVAAINSKGAGVFGATTLNGPYYEG